MRTLEKTLAAALLAALAWAPGATAEEIVSHEPDGDTGIASKYPGDVGIDKDPDVVFVESFEEGDVGKVKSRWEDTNGDLSLPAGDVPPGSTGRSALLITHTGGKGTGGQLYRRIQNPGGGYGYDKLYSRMYVKIDPDCHQIHHFGTCIGGNNPATKWPMVNAGFQTDPAKSFWSGIEPNGDAWVWDFYTYWCEMRGSPPEGKHWGNSFVRDPGLKVERGKWTCIEQMIKVNAVGDKDGEQSLWVDGRLWRRGGQVVSHQGKGFPKGKWTHDKFIASPGGEPFEGYRWRSVEELKVNFVWIYLYITSAPEGKVSKVWYDDMVVAKKYIGPIATKKAASAAEAAKESAPAPADPEAEKAKVYNQKASEVFRSARDAERQGMKDLARTLYERIVKEYPDSAVAAEAKAKLAGM